MLDAVQVAVSVAIVVIGEAIATQARARPSVPPPPAPRGWVAACAAVVAAAVAARWWSIQHVVGVGNEFVALARAQHLLHQGEARDLAALLHAPLHEQLLGSWIEALDALGLPPQARWIRLPNVALTGLLVLVLARLGLALRAPWAGLGASVVYLASPLLLQLHTNQENYLLEALGGALFAERLATCFVAGVPAYRSLAAAACLAFGAGYMNAPLLAAGAGAAVVALARGRDLRGLALSLGWTLALTGPLFARLFTATEALRAASRDPRMQTALMHETMPMSGAFGRGQAEVLWRHLLDAIGGPRGTWIVVAACAALVRPAAWVGAAVFAGTFAAGLQLPFKLQNYAPSALALVFLACWGVEEVVGRAASLVGRRVAAVARAAPLAAPAAVLLFAALAARAAHERWPLHHQHDNFLPYRDVAPLRRALDASPRLPLMIVAQRIPDPEFVELCRAVRSTTALVGCVERIRNPRGESAWTTSEVEGRPVAAPTENLTSPGVPRPLLVDAGAIIAGPKWARGFLLWTGADRPRSSPHVADALDALEARCPVVVELDANTLRRCPGR